MESQELTEVSPTQVETFSCQRKWGFYKLDGIKAPSTPRQELGTRVHKYVEDYLNKGVKPQGNTPESALALVTIPYWPDPNKVTVRAETDITFTHPSSPGVQFAGRQDAAWYDHLGYWVGDLKTTSDLKYAKSSEDLQRDPQALFYSMGALINEPEELQHVNLRWVYTRTRGALRAVSVEERLQTPYIIQAFEERIVPVANLIRKLRLEYPKVEEGYSELHGNKLPYNLVECPKFGGCYYRSNFCKLPTNVAMQQLKGELGNMDALEMLRKKKAEQTKLAAQAAQVQEEQPTAEEPTQPINPPTPAKAGGLLERLKAKASTTPAQTSLPVEEQKPVKTPECACGEPVAPGRKQCTECEAATNHETPFRRTPLERVMDSKGNTGVVAKSSKGEEVLWDKPAENKNPILTPALDNPTAPQTIATPSPVVQPARVEDTSCEATPNQGKPFSGQAIGKAAFEEYRRFREGKNHDGSAMPTWDSLPQVIRDAWQVSTGPARNLPVLCVGAIPNQSYHELSDLTWEIHRAFCEEAKVADYRLIEYGKGPGALLAFAKEYVSRKGFVPPTGYWFADLRDPITQVILPVLAPFFWSIVRAVA